MLAAVVRGDPHEVQSYIDAEGFDVNDAAAGLHGNTPLMVACAPSERLRVLALLLERTDLAKDAVNRRGMTALHQAAWYGQEGAVEMLLRAGARISIKTPTGLTAADIARQMGHSGTLKLLDEEQARQSKQQHAPAESAEQLRARIKAQYCQAREPPCRQQISAPRPLLAIPSAGGEQSKNEPDRPHLPGTPSCRQETVSAASRDATEPIPRAVERVTSASGPSRWLLSGASTARARKEREDASLLPQTSVSQQIPPCRRTDASAGDADVAGGDRDVSPRDTVAPPVRGEGKGQRGSKLTWGQELEEIRSDWDEEEDGAYNIIDVVRGAPPRQADDTPSCPARDRPAAFFITEVGL